MSVFAFILGIWQPLYSNKDVPVWRDKRNHQETAVTFWGERYQKYLENWKYILVLVFHLKVGVAIFAFLRNRKCLGLVFLPGMWNGTDFRSSVRNKKPHILISSSPKSFFGKKFGKWKKNRSIITSSRKSFLFVFRLCFNEVNCYEMNLKRVAKTFDNRASVNSIGF